MSTQIQIKFLKSHVLQSHQFQGCYKKGPADDDDDDDDEEEDFGGRERGVEEEQEEEEVMLDIRRPVNPSSHRIVNYLGMGKTEAARRKRREWPYGEPKDMASGIDYRFHTFFQQDFYSTAIIAKKKGIIAEARWIDWAYMERANNTIFRDIIDVCTSLRIKPLMGFKHSWNMEVIAQFYATVAFEEHDSVRKMHWMTEGLDTVSPSLTLLDSLDLVRQICLYLAFTEALILWSRLRRSSCILGTSKQMRVLQQDFIPTTVC
jgi:hypothetical protein